LAETVAWYRAQLGREAMREVTRRQIAAFEGAN
jgi:hypothetical protein